MHNYVRQPDAHHRAFQLEVEQTGLDEMECFRVEVNHREYLLHTAEVLNIIAALSAEVGEWYDSAGELQSVIDDSNEEIGAFVRFWRSDSNPLRPPAE